MKKLLFLLLVAFSVITLPAFCGTKTIELEPRIGYTLNDIGAYSPNPGFEIGVAASFQIVKQFHIVPVLSYIRADEGFMGKANYCMIPLYASYRIPIKNVQIDINAGPYGQFSVSNLCDFGAAAGIGAEYKQVCIGFHTYQNFLHGQNPRFYGFSLGYRFAL